MKKWFVMLSVVLLFAGCGTVGNTEKPARDGDGRQTVGNLEEGLPADGEKDPAGTPGTIEGAGTERDRDHSVGNESQQERILTANGQIVEMSDAGWAEVLTALRNLQQSELLLPKEAGVRKNILAMSVDGESHSLAQFETGTGTYLSLDNRAEYAYGGEFQKLFEKYFTEENGEEIAIEKESPEDRLVGLSVKCKEPTTREEYLNTARAVVKPWLDSLDQEEGKYKLSGYQFTDRLAENRVFHGDGFCNGGREFVCYVGFDTPTEDEDTVFYASGTYDTFYHYYFGPGILARFRWENGVCTLVAYDEAFSLLSCDTLKAGLYGISGQETGYRTFYDFQNDGENVRKWLEKDYASKLCPYRVSHNVMMLADGNVVFLDIGDSAKPTYDGELVTSDMGRYFYDTRKGEIYSSPVDFIDGSGAVVMTYRQDFPILFEDYNHDGNPDFTIRISSDEYGSTYHVCCMDINGTPWEDDGEVYVYGEFGESIRLQLSGEGALLIPADDGKGGISYRQQALFRDKSGTVHHAVTEDDSGDYRMYSQKFFLPETLRCYTDEDEEITCYFWNNTDRPVTIEERCEIQRWNGISWEKMGEGTLSGETIGGRECGEIKLNNRCVLSEEVALYRIRTMAAGRAVYGGFYYGTKGSARLRITARDCAEGVRALCFTVANDGITAVYPESASLYYNGKKLRDLDMGEISGLGGGKSQTVRITECGPAECFAVGSYVLEICAEGKKFTGTVQVAEVPAGEQYYFPERVTAEKEGEGFTLTLTNRVWNEETAVINYLSAVQVLKDGMWYDTMYMDENLTEYREDLEIPYGQTLELRFDDHSSLLEELRNYFEELKEPENMEQLEEDIRQQLEQMTFEELIKTSLKLDRAESGELCRILIKMGQDGEASEYLYFTMP